MNKALSFLLYLIVVLERRMLFGEASSITDRPPASLPWHPISELAWPVPLKRLIRASLTESYTSIISIVRLIGLSEPHSGAFSLTCNNHCGIHCRRDSERTWALPSVNRMDRSPMNIPPQLI